MEKNFLLKPLSHLATTVMPRPLVTQLQLQEQLMILEHKKISQLIYKNLAKTDLPSDKQDCAVTYQLLLERRTNGMVSEASLKRLSVKFKTRLSEVFRNALQRMERSRVQWPELIASLNNSVMIDPQKIKSNKPIANDALATLLAFLLYTNHDINAVDFNGRTLLHSAARLNNVVLVAVLLLAGAIIEKKTAHHGYTPLHYGVLSASLDVIDYLIKQGADINAQTNIGKTVLHLSAQLGNSDLTQELIQKGANATIKDHQGNTPRDLAENIKTDTSFRRKPH